MVIIGITIAFIISRALAVGVLVGLFIFFNRSWNAQKSIKEDYGFLGDAEDSIRLIMALAAYMSKADKKVSQIELDYVRDELNKSFTPEYTEKYIELYQSYLKRRVDVKKVCRVIRSKFSLSAEIQLLHFLVGIITADKFLTEEEERKLFIIARLLRVPSSSVRSVIGLFKFTREYTQKSRSEQKRSQSRPTSASKLKLAYGVLGLNKSASDSEIKKAYRKLAKVHHPDRVIHLGPEFQKKAKEKFQRLSDAYELIKDKRGFK